MGTFYALILVLMLLFKSSKTPLKDDSKLSVSALDSLFIQELSESDKSKFISHDRCWVPQRSVSSEYCMSYQMNLYNTKLESKFKNQSLNVHYTENRDVEYWQKIYGELNKHSSTGTTHIKDSLLGIARSFQLSKRELANLVVGFVQDMPYWYILENNSCNEGKYKEKPCISGVKYGLLAPQETAYVAFGDCDSKSLLLYTLLKQLDFNPIIVTSREYRHAMLALDIPTDGDFILHDGKRFYFWETTQVGWQLGMLPPSCSNIDYWDIALSYEY